MTHTRLYYVGTDGSSDLPGTSGLRLVKGKHPFPHLAASPDGRWLYITTDVAVTVKINSTSAHSITVGTTSGITVPAGVMAINKLYFSHTGASSASGDATVTIRAA